MTALGPEPKDEKSRLLTWTLQSRTEYTETWVSSVGYVYSAGAGRVTCAFWDRVGGRGINTQVVATVDEGKEKIEAAYYPQYLKQIEEVLVMEEGTDVVEGLCMECKQQGVPGTPQAFGKGYVICFRCQAPYRRRLKGPL